MTHPAPAPRPRVCRLISGNVRPAGEGEGREGGRRAAGRAGLERDQYGGPAAHHPRVAAAALQAAGECRRRFSSFVFRLLSVVVCRLSFVVI